MSIGALYGQFFTWDTLESLPKNPKVSPYGHGWVKQSNGYKSHLYCQSPNEHGPDSLYQYNKTKKRWEAIAVLPFQNQENQAHELLPIGASQLLFIPPHDDIAWSYYTITKSWTPVDIPGVSGEVLYKGKNKLTICEQKTGKVLQLRKTNQKQSFGLFNYLILFLYFGSLLMIGWHFSKRQQSAEDYFKGGGRIPWWAAGLSIFGTVLSAISFMAIPAKTFAMDWSYLLYNMGPLYIAPIVIMLFLPFFMQLNITTVYEYLENRFNVVIRLLGSLAFILYQLGRIAIVLYLPAIALNVVTGMDIMISIGIVGVISLIYTMMGGIEGVIWTDVLQVIVLMGGGFICLGLIIYRYDGNLIDMFTVAHAQQKFNVFDFSWDLKRSSLPVVLMAGVFSNLVFYGTDQTVVQRYLTANSKESASKSIWTNALLIIPGTLLFFMIGTALFLFYQSQPERMNPALAANDAIFPYFIFTELPQGLSGLLIAGVFAASMSSISSSINSIAAAYTTDFHHRFSLGGEPLKVARNASLVIGLVGTLFAMLMATWDIKSLWDEFLKILGLITGGMGGVFVLGFISKRAHSYGVLVGLIGSAIFQAYIAMNQTVHLLLFTSTGFISCLVLGYVASLIIPKK